MQCSNCGMDMSKKGYCMHCGYMSNGVVIDTSKPQHASLLELYFGTDYDKITKNQNWFISGLLGPTYLLCHKHYLVGFLLIILDIFLSLCFVTINTALMIPSISTVYWIINRVIWGTINNMIYIKLEEKRLVSYKEKYKDDFELKIQELYQKDNRLLVFKYIVFGLIFLIIYWFLQNILYYYVSLI